MLELNEKIPATKNTFHFLLMKTNLYFWRCTDYLHTYTVVVCYVQKPWLKIYRQQINNKSAMYIYSYFYLCNASLGASMTVVFYENTSGLYFIHYITSPGILST